MGKNSASKIWWVVFGVLGLGAFGFMGLVFILFAAMMGGGGASFGTDPVVVVRIEGPIYNTEDVLKELHEYGENKKIKAILVRIDSPGGAVGPSQEVYRELKRLREKGKVVVASMSTVAASGGYYIAAGADQIVANPGTITGSIGVIMQSFGLKDVAEFLKVEPRIVKSGKYKDVGNPFRDVSDEEKIYLQQLSEDMYSQFLEDVASQRKIPLDEMKKIAEGKVYSGRQAKDLKLVDELGNLFDAIALAKSLAKLPESAEVQWPKKPTPLDEFLAGSALTKALQNTALFLGNARLPLWAMP